MIKILNRIKKIIMLFTAFCVLITSLPFGGLQIVYADPAVSTNVKVVLDDNHTENHGTIELYKGLESTDEAISENDYIYHDNTWNLSSIPAGSVLYVKVSPDSGYRCAGLMFDTPYYTTSSNSYKQNIYSLRLDENDPDQQLQVNDDQLFRFTVRDTDMTVKPVCVPCATDEYPVNVIVHTISGNGDVYDGFSPLDISVKNETVSDNDLLVYKKAKENDTITVNIGNLSDSLNYNVVFFRNGEVWNPVTDRDIGDGYSCETPVFSFSMTDGAVDIVITENRLKGSGEDTPPIEPPVEEPPYQPVATEEGEPGIGFQYRAEWANMEDGYALMRIDEEDMSAFSGTEIKVNSPQVVTLAIDMSSSMVKNKVGDKTRLTAAKKALKSVFTEIKSKVNRAGDSQPVVKVNIVIFANSAETIYCNKDITNLDVKEVMDAISNNRNKVFKSGLDNSHYDSLITCLLRDYKSSWNSYKPENRNLFIFGDFHNNRKSQVIKDKCGKLTDKPRISYSSTRNCFKFFIIKYSVIPDLYRFGITPT